MTNLILTGAKIAPLLLQVAGPNPGAVTPEVLRQQIALEAVKRSNTPVNSVLALLVPYALFAMILAIIWLSMKQKQARLQKRAEFHKQLLDKFSSGREFAEFLESKGSQRFLEELWSQGAQSNAPPLRGGIVLTTLGLALCGLSWRERSLLTPGVILLALGVGCLISSAISYRLSKDWKQAKEPGPGNAPTV